VGGGGKKRDVKKKTHQPKAALKLSRGKKKKKREKRVKIFAHTALNHGAGKGEKKRGGGQPAGSVQIGSCGEK